MSSTRRSTVASKLIIGLWLAGNATIILVMRSLRVGITIFVTALLILLTGSLNQASASGPPRIFIVLPTDGPPFTPIGISKTSWANITFGGDSPFVDLAGDNNPAGQRSNPFPFTIN